MSVFLKKIGNKRSWLPATVLVILAGCSTVDPSLDYVRTATKVEQATGHSGLYRSFEETDAVQLRIVNLLEDSLSVDESVEICLLNNAALQAASLDVGLAHADLVQSGLLSNPSVNALVRIPVEGGQSAVEAGIIQNLIELWQIPAKKRLAQKDLERTVLHIAYQASTTVYETKRAYFEAVAAKEIIEVEKQNLATAMAFLELVTAQQQSGSATEIDVNAARSEVFEQEVFLRSAQLSLFEKKRGLALLMGLGISPDDITLSDQLPSIPLWKIEVQQLLSIAQENRIDLQSARENVLAALQALSLEKRLFISNAKVGVGLESEEGIVSVGPAVSLEIPVLDQNQAQIAKADIRYAQANKTLESITVAVVQQVRGAHENFLAASDVVRAYKEKILPLGDASLELAQESFRAGKTGILSVLVTQRRLLGARREYYQKVQQLALSIINLEATTGLPIPVLLERTKPTS